MELQAAGRYKEDTWTIQDDVFRMYSKAMAEDKKRQVMNAIVPPERRLVVCDMVWQQLSKVFSLLRGLPRNE